MGCTTCSSGGEYDFRSRKEALDKYHGYLQKVRGIAHTNTKEFGETLREWHEVSDTVYKYLAKDSVFRDIQLIPTLSLQKNCPISDSPLMNLVSEEN